MADINIGIVGTGMMLDYHFNAFRKIPNINIKRCTREFYCDVEKKIAKKSIAGYLRNTWDKTLL